MKNTSFGYQNELLRKAGEDQRSESAQDWHVVLACLFIVGAYLIAGLLGYPE